jgi:hypothetical protein
MNVAIFLDIEPCGAHVNRRFGGTYHLQLQATICTLVSLSANFRP